MEHKNRRRVTLQGKYRPSTGWNSKSKTVPWLAVGGLWLEQAGFAIGDQLQITIANDRLIITKEKCHGDQHH